MIHPIQKEEELAKDAVKMELARKVLEAAMHAIDDHDKKGLLDHSLLAERYAKKREEEIRREKCRKVLGGILGLAGAGTFAAYIIKQIRDHNEITAAIHDEEQKELYRKLSAIKGR